MLVKKLCLYLSAFLLLFPFKLAFGSEFGKVNSLGQESSQINENLPTKISSTPDPPDDNPGGGDGGGTRLFFDPIFPPARVTHRGIGIDRTRGKCPQDGDNRPYLTLLVLDNQARLTYPTFLAFVPETKAKKGEFILYDRTTGNLIHQTTFNLTGVPGIVSVQVPIDKESLKVGNEYEWRFSLYCKENGDRSADPIEIGYMRVENNQLKPGDE